VKGKGLALGTAFVIGIGLGILFFGGLWWTVQRLPTASWPALLALGSFWGRTAVCGAGFYLVMDGHWARLSACFLGFLGARTILVRHWRPRGASVTAAAPRGEPL